MLRAIDVGDTDALLGTVLSGRYCIRRLIARGGMGEVFEATDEQLPNQRVAVKLLRADFDHDREWRARFKREAAIAASIRSPYVAELLNFGKTRSGRRWIAFELLDGESLDSVLEREGALPFKEVAWMVRHTLAALDAAHEAGVIHRDIKPANLFIVRLGPRLCVLDFGVAKRHATASSGLTGVHTMVGTPSYMSPEQFVNAKDVDHRTDLYSVGLVTYRALAVRAASGGNDIATVFGRKRRGELPSLALATGVSWPDAIEAWIQQMVATDPRDRFESARAAMNAWKHSAAAMDDHEPVPIERGYVHDDTDVAPITELDEMGPEPRSKRRR